MILHWYGIVDEDPMAGGVGRPRAVGAMASPDFDRSVNFISTGGGGSVTKWN